MGGGIGMGNTCKPMAVSFQCMTKFTTNKKKKKKKRLPGEVSITSDMQMTPTLMAESEEELKSLLMKLKEDSEKSWLKAQHSEN